jgi:hypothetical protein
MKAIIVKNLRIVFVDMFGSVELRESLGEEVEISKLNI